MRWSCPPPSPAIPWTPCAGVTSYFYRLGDDPILPDVGFELVTQAAAGSVLSKVSGFMATGSGFVATCSHSCFCTRA